MMSDELLTLYSYALIKTLYDETNNYLLSFSPFILNTINDDKYYSYRETQKLVYEKYGFNMPIHIIEAIFIELKKNNFVGRKGNVYTLVEKGIEYRNLKIDDKEVNRKINFLYSDIIEYFNSKNIILTKEELVKLISDFLLNNVYQIIEMINADEEYEFEINVFNISYQILLEYIITANDNKPEHYKILMDIMHGAIISILLHTNNKNDMDNIIKREFKDVDVYLDTNYVFSLLGYHHKEYSIPARELYDMLIKYDFNLYVFDFTVDKMCRVINGYAINHKQYVKGINVNNVYSGLKNLGWSPTDAKRFIINVDNILSDYNIKIKDTDIVNIETYESSRPELTPKIYKYKSVWITSTQNHDVAAIDKIIQIRKKQIRNICNSKAIFLSSDWGLSAFNHNEYSHKKSGTIDEVILDKHFGKILWLKHPNIQLSLNTLFTLYADNLFISRQAWEKFYSQLVKLRNQEKISDTEITMILHHQNLEDSLRNTEYNDLDIINEDFILDNLKEAKNRDIKLKEEITLELSEMHEDELKKLDKKYNQEWLLKVQNYKDDKKKEANNESNIISIILSLFLFIIIFGISVLIFPYIKPTLDFYVDEKLLQLLLKLIYSTSLFGIIWRNIRKYTYQYFIHYLYNRKIKDIDKLMDINFN